MPASKFGAAAKRSHPPVVVPSLGPPYFGLECGLAPGSDQGLHERPVGNSVKQRFRGNATLKKSDRKRLHMVAVCGSSQHQEAQVLMNHVGPEVHV